MYDRLVSHAEENGYWSFLMGYDKGCQVSDIGFVVGRVLEKASDRFGCGGVAQGDLEHFF